MKQLWFQLLCHVCLKCVNEQVWLRRQYVYPASIPRITKLSLSLLEGPQLQAAATPTPAAPTPPSSAPETVLRELLALHKCDDLLRVGPVAPDAAFDPLSRAVVSAESSSEGGDSAAVELALRHVFACWMRAQMTFLESCVGSKGTMKIFPIESAVIFRVLFLGTVDCQLPKKCC